MKTTKLERERYKQGRRTVKMRKLIQKLNLRIGRSNSEKLQQEIDIILEKLAKTTFISLQLDAIRRAS